MRDRKLRISLHNQQNKKGFTLAEFLIAAGILAILAAFGFVAVASYQRKLKLTEMDDTAREIFVAAQNHLTAAKASGEWDELIKNHKNDTWSWGSMTLFYKPSDYPDNETEVWEEHSFGYTGVVKDKNNLSGPPVHEYYLIPVFEKVKREEMKKGALGVLLPDGAIDSTITESGSYYIEYDKITASIYGVFYTDAQEKDLSSAAWDAYNERKTVGGETGTGRDDSSVGRKIRLNYKDLGRNVVVGYYGGAMAQKLTSGESEVPEVEVHNAETLSLSVTDKNAYADHKSRMAVEITGEESGAKETWPLTLDDTGEKKIDTSGKVLSKLINDAWEVSDEGGYKKYTLTFDDITKKGGHFADLFPEFIPGENLVIKVSCTSTTKLSATRYAEAYTNSLFESRYDMEDASGKSVSEKSEVTVAYIRHLQNLSPDVSRLPMNTGKKASKADNKKYVVSALQTKDLDWNSKEAQEVYENAPIYIYVSNGQEEVEKNQFYGINNYALEKYTGEKKGTEDNKEIRNLSIQGQSDVCGLFTYIGSASGGAGATSQKLEVSNLTLKGFTIAAEEDSGVLAGTVGDSATLSADNVFIVDPTVNSKKGSAGGLAGKISNGEITGCGVFFVSDEKNNAEEKTGVDIRSGIKKTAAQKYGEGACDITKLDTEFGEGKYHIWSGSNGNAGGLIGSATGNTVTEDCFAAVPVITEDGAAGGLLGNVQGTAIQVYNSYTGGFTQDKNVNNIYSIVMKEGSSGNSAAGGLIGVAESGIKVENCYSTASVYGYYAGGFVGRDDNGISSYSNCYAVNKVEKIRIDDKQKDNTKTGAFAAILENAALQNCYYVREINASLSGIKGKDDGNTGVSGLFYDELKSAEFKEIPEGERGTAPLLASESVRHATYPYDLARYADNKIPDEELYPFATVNNTAKKYVDNAFSGTHIGDWIENNDQEIGLVYYEKVGKETSYHGYIYNKNVENSEQEIKGEIPFAKSADKYVKEDGYLLLITKDTKLGSLSVTVGNSEKISADNIFLETKATGILSEELEEKYDAYYLDLSKTEENKFESDKATHVLIDGAVQADFTLTPDFADSVQCGEQEQKEFYIRAARHLANLEGSTGYAANEKYLFKQQMDIDNTADNYSYSDIEGMNSNNIDTDFSQPISSMKADYESETYINPGDGNVYAFKIRGLQTTMFATIDEDSVIKGVTLTDVQNTGANTTTQSVAGFVDTNNGTIESCGIRPDNTGKGNHYSDVSISSKGMESVQVVAGFAGYNGKKGTIKNSYVIGSVEAAGTGDERIAGGVAGFVYSNEGIIDSCYANSIVSSSIEEAFPYVGGFSSTNYGDAEILNCHFTGSVKAEKDYSMVSGFSGANAGEIVNSYCAPWEIKGDVYYEFAMSYYSGIAENCYYYSDIRLTGNPGEGRQGQEKSYAELEELAENSATENSTKKYYQYNKDANKIYPFDLPSTDTSYITIQHYGDWPTGEAAMELAYYEVYEQENGKYALGLYSKELKINSLIENLSKGTHIIQDGYVLLTTSKGDYAVDGESCHSVTDILYKNNPISVLGNDLSGAAWSSGAEEMTADTRLNTGESNYLLKFFDLKTVDALSDDTYFSKIEVSGANTKRYFYYNPHYAKSLVQNCGEDESEKLSIKMPASISIRTERQYSMMTQDLRNPGTNVFNVYAKASYIQQNDLAYGTSCKYVNSYFGKDTNQSQVEKDIPVLKPIAVAANTPKSGSPQDTVGFRGIYDGGNYKIQQLSITGEPNKSAGIFGNTQGAIIKNLTLSHIDIKGKSDYSGILIGNAAHLSTGGNPQIYTAIQNIMITDSNVTGKRYVGGLVGAGYSCSVNPGTDSEDTVEISNITVIGDSCIGGMFGYISDYSSSMKNGLQIQNMDGQELEVKESSVHASVEQECGIGGFAGRISTVYGIKNTNKNTSLSILNVSIAESTLQVDENADEQKYIAGGLWVGNLNYVRDSSGMQTLPIYYSNCQITDSVLNTSAGASLYHASYGGLYGRVKAGNATDKIVLDEGILGARNKISAQTDNESMNIIAGGLAGYVSGLNLSLQEKYNMPKLNGFNKNNTYALGGFIGCLEKVTFVNTDTYHFGNLVSPKDSSAKNLGGFLGYSKDSEIKNISVSGFSSANKEVLESVNLGVIAGSAAATIFDNIHVGAKDMDSYIDASKVIAENFGAVSGYVESTSQLKNVECNNTDIRANARNIGGTVGKFAGKEFASSQLQNVSIQGLGDNVGGAIGLCNSPNGKVSEIRTLKPIINTSVFSDELNVGGAIGKFMSGNGTDIKTVDETITASSRNIKPSNIGGVIGEIEGASSLEVVESSGNTQILNSQVQNVGGVIGNVVGASAKTVKKSGGFEVSSYLPNIVLENVGGILGSMASGNVSDIHLETDSLTATQEIADFGGGVGIISGGTLTEAAIGLTASSESVFPDGKIYVTNAENVGGMAGKVTNVSEGISGLVQNIEVNVSEAKNIGGFAGCIIGKIKECYTDNISVVGNDVQHIGGFSGTIDGGIVTNCDVRLSSIAQNAKQNDAGGFNVSSNMVQADIGGFVGVMENGAIRQSFAAIPVMGAGGSIGGFAGRTQNTSIIEKCYATGNVSGNRSLLSTCYTGGFAGVIQDNSNIFDCYSTGKVLAGDTIGGFAGRVDKNALAYLNNCYSLGTVNQETKIHGGFVGAYDGKIVDESTGLSAEDIALFYKLLKFDLRGAAAQEDDENGLYHLCLKRLDARKLGTDKNEYNNIYDYIINYSDTIDSTAVKMDLADYPDIATQRDVPVAAIINKLMQTEEFRELASLFRDWKIVKSYSSINLIYTFYDLNAVYKSGVTSVDCYQFIEKSGKTLKGSATVINSTDVPTYGEYPKMNQFVEGTKGEFYTGCVYLSDAKCKYNIANDWSDDNLIQDGILRTKTFDEMTTKNQEYVKELNSNVDGIEVNRFTAHSTVANTYRYDKILPEVYPYPTLTGPIGCNVPESSHWGDWPDKPEVSDFPDFDFGIVYYEKIEGDDKVYYHGWGCQNADAPDNENSYVEIKTPGVNTANGLLTGPDKYVVEDGYLLVVQNSAVSGGMSNISVVFGENEYNGTLVNGENLKKVFKDNSNPVFPLGYSAYNLKSSEWYNGWTFANQKNKVSVQEGVRNDYGEQKWVIKAKFNMTPHFGDSVGYMANGMSKTEYYIRSAQQLVTLSNQVPFTTTSDNAKNNVFKQQLDIDLSRTTLQYKSIGTMKGKYISEKYSVEGETKCYKIHKLNTCMFNNNEGVLQGITLTDTQINGNAGLVNKNMQNAVIDSCSIRPDTPSEGAYSNVVIENNYGNAAGLVNENQAQAIIRNSYVSGTIYGYTAAGFVAKNLGTIENCYSNCIVNGEDTAAGFCGGGNGGSNVDQGKIIDCYGTGKVESGNWAYGFIGANGASVSNCYSAPFSIQGSNIYMFGNNSGEGKSDKCYWLKGIEVSENISNQNECGEAITYNNLRNKSTSPKTYKYNSSYENIDTTNATYPFRLESTEDAYLPMQHWGDWPAKPATKTKPAGVGIVYYEKIKNDSLVYYHGYDKNGNEIASVVEGANDNGLAVGTKKEVEESGYLLIMEGSNYAEQSIKTFINNSKNKIDGSYLYERNDSILNLGNDYSVFKMKKEAYTKFNDYGTNKIEINKGNVNLVFTMTPYFADTVQPGDQTSNKDQIFAIRSPEHLRNLQKLEDFADNEDHNYTFIQQLDIDARTLPDSIDDFSETYKAAADNKWGYEILNLSVPLFDEIKKDALLDRITIFGLSVISNEDDGVSGLALENKGTIQNCAILSAISDGKYESNTITSTSNKEDGHGAAGFVVENKKEGTIRNCYITAVVTGERNAAGFVLKNEGTIETSYSNCIVESEAGNAAGFCYSNVENGNIVDSHSLLKVVANQGMAFGFMGENKEGAKVHNCYTALQSLTGKNTDTFGGSAAKDGDNYYLNTVEITAGKDGEKINSGTGKTYAELAEMSESAPAKADTTIKYGEYNTNTSDNVYPFALPETSTSGNAWFVMKHYGDWPVSETKNRMFTAKQDTDVYESERPKEPDTNQLRPIAGLAYREASADGYEGWYAITASAAGETITTNEQTPYDTLRTDRNTVLADDTASYGILVESGTKPQVSGIQVQEEMTDQVTIDDILYDYYQIVPGEEVHEDITFTMIAGENEFAFTYNPDFAAAVSYEMSLGTAAEDGGRPYQIRTEAQLRNMNENHELYLNAAFRQTLDIVLGDENFVPIGGVASWADGAFEEIRQESADVFAGSYDAGLVKDGRRSTDSSQDEEQDGSADEVKIPEGYSITGLNQTVTLSKADSSRQMYTGLFAKVSGTVRNVNVSGSINLVQSEADSLMTVYAGSIAGFCTETGDITGCSSDVDIHTETDCTEMNIGGLTGYMAGSLADSYYNGTIDGVVKLAGVKGKTAVIGGAVGTNTGSVTRSAACAVVSLKVENLHKETDSYLGGFAGRSFGEDSTVTDSWSKCFLEGNGSVTGGFVGLVAGDKKKYTVLTDNYAVISIQNPEKVKSAGLFAGYMQTDQIWRCHAVFLDGDVTENQVFANGVAADRESRDCYLMPGVDRDILTALNGGDMFELINSMYPTLHDNPERETDIIRITSVGGSLQREEKQSQTDEMQGDISEGTQGTKPEGEPDTSQSTAPKDGNTDSNAGNVSDVPADSVPDNQNKDKGSVTNGIDNSNSGQNHSQGTTGETSDTNNTGENPNPGKDAADAVAHD